VICCNACGRNSPIALMLSMLLVVVILNTCRRGSNTCVLAAIVYYWLLRKYSLIKSVHSLWKTPYYLHPLNKCTYVVKKLVTSEAFIYS
jgi:hypothetical protein